MWTHVTLEVCTAQTISEGTGNTMSDIFGFKDDKMVD